MDLDDQTSSDLGLYFSHQSLVGLEKGFVSLDGNCHPCCNIWSGTEQVGVKSCNNRSFATNARLRLESLKSGYNSALTRWAADSMLDSCRDQKEMRENEEQTQEQESALDCVELLEVGEEEQDEENWLVTLAVKCLRCRDHEIKDFFYRLYQPTKRQLSEDEGDSALRWCRHVLDNPSPETAAVCRSLINRLDQGKHSTFLLSFFLSLKLALG